MKRAVAVITMVGAVAIIIFSGCTRPLGDMAKSALEKVEKR